MQKVRKENRRRGSSYFPRDRTHPSVWRSKSGEPLSPQTCIRRHGKRALHEQGCSPPERPPRLLVVEEYRQEQVAEGHLPFLPKTCFSLQAYIQQEAELEDKPEERTKEKQQKVEEPGFYTPFVRRRTVPGK